MFAYLASSSFPVDARHQQLVVVGVDVPNRCRPDAPVTSTTEFGSRSDEKQQRLKQIGATFTFNPEDPQWPSGLK